VGFRAHAEVGAPDVVDEEPGLLRGIVSVGVAGALRRQPAVAEQHRVERGISGHSRSGRPSSDDHAPCLFLLAAAAQRGMILLPLTGLSAICTDRYGLPGSQAVGPSTTS
jgi:hypothetical protein